MTKIPKLQRLRIELATQEEIYRNVEESAYSETNPEYKEDMGNRMWRLAAYIRSLRIKITELEEE